MVWDPRQKKRSARGFWGSFSLRVRGLPPQPEEGDPGGRVRPRPAPRALRALRDPRAAPRAAPRAEPGARRRSWMDGWMPAPVGGVGGYQLPGLLDLHRRPAVAPRHGGGGIRRHLRPGVPLRARRGPRRDVGGRLPVRGLDPGRGLRPGRHLWGGTSCQGSSSSAQGGPLLPELASSSVATLRRIPHRSRAASARGKNARAAAPIDASASIEVPLVPPPGPSFPPASRQPRRRASPPGRRGGHPSVATSASSSRRQR